MIQSQTVLNVSDNTGAKKLMCIKVLTSKARYGFVGDVIIGVVKLCLKVKLTILFLNCKNFNLELLFQI